MCVCVLLVWFWTVMLLYSEDDHTTARDGARRSHVIHPVCEALLDACVSFSRYKVDASLTVVLGGHGTFRPQCDVRGKWTPCRSLVYYLMEQE